MVPDRNFFSVNKRGMDAVGWISIIVVILFVAGGIIMALIPSSLWSNWNIGDVSVDTQTDGFENHIGGGFVWANYIFGGVPLFLVDLVGPNSAIIITIAMFIFLFITFGDIISNFGFFNRSIAWISAFLLSIIAANLKAVAALLSLAIGVFSFLGGLAVLFGLATAFVVFIAVNLGIGSLGPWIMRRNAMNYAARKAADMEAGGIEVAGTLRGLKEVGKSLKKM